jgi:hypothetical protein
MSTHDLELHTVVTNPETVRSTRRISPITNEITSQIISWPVSAAPEIAPDIPFAIDPGPVLGVARDDLTDATVDEAVRLPLDLDDRALIDPTIATRNLVRTLHRTPRHVVLVFSGPRVRLLEWAAGRLEPAASTTFPMDLPALDGSAPDGGSMRSALAAVDAALGGYLRLRPAPVILAGPQKLVSAFWSESRNLARLAGTVYGGFDDVPTEDLVRRIRPVLDRYLDSHQYAAMALLEERGSDQRVVSGIPSAWHAARTQQPEMLLVEDGYRYTARVSTDSDAVTPANEVTAPADIDNLVDELIETVLARGGSVVLAHDGALAEHGRVALTLR